MSNLARVILAVAALLLATCVVAQEVPSPDLLGFYFDENALVQAFCGGFFTYGTGYLILTNPSHEVLYGWEAALPPFGERTLFLGAAFAEEAENLATFPEMKVTYESPLPLQPLTVLATVEFVTATEWEVNCLVLTGISEPAIASSYPLVWWEKDVPSVVETDKFFPNGVVATIGGCPAVPEGDWDCRSVVKTKSLSWASLKSMFR